MTTTMPEIKDNDRYPIGETAKILGICRDTLRKHTEEGYIKCIYNRVNKRRLYTGAEIKRYWNSYS
ncbi:helix-turn-helix domain-containing protein [Paludibacter sp. 221]|uniref:helix-turn-helix domain-containing protein n=1 Tax=Paludibacter sp. 221 TaxID=2302939 RepID=UPI0013D11669|nr:helix-turn-helix domain-containing protein [Paludibacter sp. 221]NDV46135.1 helix-turn-helix domain-containing protein [Paludibacter sp. 221]